VQPEQFPEVLRLARAGDEAAFTQLFRDTQPVVLRYLASLAATDLVDDVASDTWVSVIKSMDTFRDDDPGGFRAWVLTIARRRWVDEVRRRSRRHEMPDNFESAPDLPSSFNVEGEVQQRLGSDAAIALIRRLPADQAEVITLRTISGLSVEDVAQIVGKKPGTVRVLSHRGLRKLAELLGDGVTESLPDSIEEVT
jgi:RNA polymerase sigma-70 factor (ECF subfamily)